LKVCVDKAGKLDNLQTVRRSKGYDGYVRTVEQAAATWKFTPFTVHDRPVAVCALDLIAYPPDRKMRLLRPPPPPPPPPPPEIVTPMTLDALRISGNKNIVPDDKTKTEIARSGKDKIIGSFKLCLSMSGAITSVTVLK